jgi:hypothetical protein
MRWVVRQRSRRNPLSPVLSRPVKRGPQAVSSIERYTDGIKYWRGTQEKSKGLSRGESKPRKVEGNRMVGLAIVLILVLAANSTYSEDDSNTKRGHDYLNLKSEHTVVSFIDIDMNEYSDRIDLRDTASNQTIQINKLGSSDKIFYTIPERKKELDSCLKECLARDSQRLCDLMSVFCQDYEAHRIFALTLVIGSKAPLYDTLTPRTKKYDSLYYFIHDIESGLNKKVNIELSDPKYSNNEKGKTKHIPPSWHSREQIQSLSWHMSHFITTSSQK